MIPIHNYLFLSLLLFGIGIIGFMIRKNLLIMLMSIELMLNSVNLAFVSFNKVWTSNIDGEVMALFSIAIAAAEVAIGLAISVVVYRNLKHLRTDKIDTLNK